MQDKLTILRGNIGKFSHVALSYIGFRYQYINLISYKSYICVCFYRSCENLIMKL